MLNLLEALFKNIGFPRAILRCGFSFSRTCFTIGVMKRALIIFAALLFLASCGNGDVAQLGPETTKPGIPQRKPSLPSQKSLEANALGTHYVNPRKEDLEMQALIDRLDNNIARPNITIEDIKRGWYTGQVHEKKIGTPNSWLWIDRGPKSVWSSPSALDETEDQAKDTLCRQTAGFYAFSCIEREYAGCENIATSICRCPDQTKWIDKQGCVLLNNRGESVVITPNDLKRGWYYGLNSEKKLDTPAAWMWLEAGKDSRWQAPNPIDQN